MKLIVQSGAQQGLELELRHGLNTIGRADTNDFALDDDSVSSHHCVLSVQAGAITVRDLDSTNGTFIDGELVREKPLLPGQTLRLGDVELFWDRNETVVSVPEIHRPAVEVAVALPDGTPCCVKHSTAPALWECPKCQNKFCGPCVHRLRRVGGPVHNFCPTCRTECIWIGPKRERKAGFLAAVTRAVRSTFRKK